MATNGPDPAEFLEKAQQMLRELFGGAGSTDEPWAEATRSGAARSHREPTPERQRENLTFALATRAVEALEDLALNVAAIRQRLERTAGPAPGQPLDDGEGGQPDVRPPGPTPKKQ